MAFLKLVGAAKSAATTVGRSADKAATAAAKAAASKAKDAAPAAAKATASKAGQSAATAKAVSQGASSFEGTAQNATRSLWESDKVRAVTASSAFDRSLVGQKAMAAGGQFGVTGPWSALGSDGVIPVMQKNISNKNWENAAKFATDHGGPRSAAGPWSPVIGTDSPMADLSLKAMGLDDLGLGGRNANLGNNGVYSINGVTGLAGPGGGHGLKLTEKGFVNKAGQVVRTDVAPDGSMKELVEVYSSQQANAMRFDAPAAMRPDTSFFVHDGLLENVGDVKRFPFQNTTGTTQAINIQVIPEWSKLSPTQAMSKVTDATIPNPLKSDLNPFTSALPGADPVAWATGKSLDGRNVNFAEAFDTIHLYVTDENGRRLFKSVANDRPNWMQVNLPKDAKGYIEAVLVGKGDHTGAAPFSLSVNPTYKDMSKVPERPFHVRPSPLPKDG